MELETKEKLLLEQKPKVEFAEQLLQSTNGIDFATSSKAMNLPFGRNRLFQICRDQQWLNSKNQPYQNFVDLGYFVVLETSFAHPTSGDTILTTKTLITAKGQKWILKELKELNLLSN
jgi:phage antirepressor YoqD-like protein